MPSTSDAQARFMAAAAHNPSIAAQHGISQSTAAEFNQADASNGRLHNAMLHRARVKRTKTAPVKP